MKQYNEENEGLQLVIFEGNLKKFDYNLLDYLIDKKIKVSGEIEDYKGQIEIIVDSPLQFMILEEDESN